MNSKFRNFLEKAAVPNLARYVTVVFCIGFVFMLTDFGWKTYAAWLVFDAEKVLQGQVWRILTTLFYPPFGRASLGSYPSILLGALGIYIYYNFAISVERVLGEAEFNLYFFGSILIGEFGSLIYYLLIYWIFGYAVQVWYLPMYTHFSVFLAFAILYSDASVLLFFVIPVKAKIVAWVELGLYLINFVKSLWYGSYFDAVLIFCALIPVGIFYLRHRNIRSGGELIGRIRYRRQQKRRQKEWKDQWKD